MHCTDICTCSYPAGDSSLTRMTMEAGALGFDTIVLPVEQPAVIGNVSVLPARVIETRHVREVIRDLGRTKEGQVMIVMAGDASFIRGVVPLRGVHCWLGSSDSGRTPSTMSPPGSPLRRMWGLQSTSFPCCI